MINANLFVAIVLAVLTAVPRAADSRQAPATGTAELRGTVVTTDATPVPVRRALVTLRDDGPFARTAISDDQGRFEFTQLPAGRFTLTASRPAFVAATYGARKPGRPGTPLSIAAGQSMTGVTLYMAKGAAISGTVRDPNGRPAAKVEVLVRPVGALVEATFVSRGATQILTDDRGMYRAYGLAPGAYVVAAVPQLGFGTTEMRAMTPAEIDAALRALAARQPPPAPAPSAPAPPRRMYVPVFHPNVASQSDATPVTVNAGDDVGGIDIALGLVSAITIEGQIVRPDGAPPAGIRLSISGAGNRMPVSFTTAAPVLTTRPGQDGRFKYSSIAPGAYTIIALSQDGLYAVSRITAGGDDVTGVTLALQPGLTFSGVVRFDASTLTPPKGSPAGLTLQPAGPYRGGTAVSSGTAYATSLMASAAVGGDGTFRVAGLVPGQYNVVVPTLAGWWLRSVMVDGRDVLDELMTVDADVSQAQIIYSDRHSELSGILQTPSGVPAPEFDILILSADKRHWFAGSRRTRTAKPGTDGRYVFTDLPAGEYLVAALDDLDPAQLDDSAFLERVAPNAVRTTVQDGAKVQLDLKIAR